MADFIKTSDLRERITFVKLEKIKDGKGQVKTTEVEKFSCWSSVRSMMLKDKVASVGTILENTITFVIRYQQKDAIKNDYQIKWQNKTFNILSIDEGYFKKDFTTIIAKEV